MISFAISILKTSLLTAPIIFLLLVEGAFRNKSDPTLRLALWKVVGVLMIFPQLLQKVFSWIFFTGVGKHLYITDYSAVATAFAQIEKQITLVGTVVPAGGGGGRNLSVYAVLVIVYLLIALGILLWKLLQHSLFLRNLHRWSRKVTDRKTLLELENLKKKYQIRGEISLVYCEEASSPMLVGMCHPTIVLPEKEFSSEEIHYVLSHELTHYKGKDLWIQLFFLVITLVYWANPLVYLMRKQVENDMEIACDAKVVSALNQNEKQRYCRTIVSFAVIKSNMLTTGFSNKYNTKRRMENILHKGKKKKGLWLIVAATLLMGLMAACMQEAPPAVEKNALQPIELTSVSEGEKTEIIEKQPLIDPESQNDMQTSMKEEIDGVYTSLNLSNNDGDDLTSLKMGWPVPNYYVIGSPYGWRMDGADFHSGIDINGEEILGKDVVSAAEGEVVFVNDVLSIGQGYGNYLVIDHGEGVTTLYSALAKVNVSVGQKVAMGEKIGEVGSTGFSTGPHLHFEVRINGVNTNPEDFLME